MTALGPQCTHVPHATAACQPPPVTPFRSSGVRPAGRPAPCSVHRVSVVCSAVGLGEVQFWIPPLGPRLRSALGGFDGEDCDEVYRPHGPRRMAPLVRSGSLGVGVGGPRRLGMPTVESARARVYWTMDAQGPLHRCQRKCRANRQGSSGVGGVGQQRIQLMYIPQLQFTFCVLPCLPCLKGNHCGEHGGLAPLRPMLCPHQFPLPISHTSGSESASN